MTREVQKIQDQPTGPSTYIPKLTILIRCAEYCQPHRSVEKNTGDLWTKWQSDARR
jgi:hypothetical protein